MASPLQLNESILKRLFEFQVWYQAELGLAVGSMPPVQAARYMILCAQVELAELLNEFPGWKATKQHEIDDPSPRRVALEAADVLVFLVNVMIHAGVNTETFIDAIEATIDKNYDRLAKGKNTATDAFL
jgi:hypothetical protein